jgi:DNA polymerase-3 subunit delta'
MTQRGLPVHLDILERFSVFRQHGRLAHAYLFAGPPLVGKTVTALAVAKLVNDELTLEEARRGLPADFIDAIRDRHPDLRLISSQAFEAIKMDAVRELLRQVKLRPFQSLMKVFVLQNVDRLTMEGANALLKTLEEPSDRSLLILTTAAPENVLPTIRSRCQTVVFAPGAPESVAAALEKDYGIRGPEGRFLAGFSGGGLGRALDLKKQDSFSKKNELLDEFLRGPGSDGFIKKLTADKEQAKFFLEILLAWVRDAILLKSGQKATPLVHQDRAAEIEHFQRRLRLDDLWGLYRQVVQASRQLADNLNLKVPLMIIKEQIYGTNG